MGALIKLAICFYVICLSIGALAAIFKFIFDVHKWHDKEDKVKILPSRIFAEEFEREEVEEIERRDFRTGTGTGDDTTGTGDNNIDTGDGTGDRKYNYHTNNVLKF